MSRLAVLLRRLADRVDPPARVSASAAPTGEVKLVSRSELREIQKGGMRMIDDYFYLSRRCGPDDGLLWIPTDVLHSIAWLIGLEIEVRDRDFATIENDRPRSCG